MAHDSHIPDEDLLMALDGEQPEWRLVEVRAHLAACWECRARSLEIEQSIREFVGVYGRHGRPLPRTDGPRSLLKLRLKELREKHAHGRWNSIAFLSGRANHALPLIVVIVGASLLISLYSARLGSQSASAHELQFLPDPRLTPGAAVPMDLDDSCGSRNAARPVPDSLARQTFDSYKITDPSANKYEVDYLITPELGGVEDIRNIWPEPYAGTEWNSHLKDALEDYLRQLVCGRTLDLATAQREIATDWVSAYKKYFRTKQPLPEHLAFLKDQPWE